MKRAFIKQPLLIGYGNCLREDDAVGWHAAERAGQTMTPGSADVIQACQLTPELAAKIAGASVVIFFDAALDQQPGSVRIQCVEPEDAQSWTHHVSPGQILGMAAQLDGGGPPAFLITGGVERVGWNEHLSSGGEAVAAEMAVAGARILKEAR
jgi:hydrogenase maturation protease